LKYSGIQKKKKKRKRITVGTVYSGRLHRGKKQLVNYGSDGQVFIKPKSLHYLTECSLYFLNKIK